MPHKKISTKQNFPYKNNGYNLESGKKTLALVGICILLVLILSITSFFLMIYH